MLYDDLNRVNTSGLEAEISAGIVERIAKEMPDLTDHSPASPHVIIAEGVAWGTSLLMYYLSRQPELYENWLMKNFFAATPRPPTNARAELMMLWSTPAPEGGRLISAGTQFIGGGTTWTVLDSFIYPPGAVGNEMTYTDIGPRPLYLIPVVADAAGSRYNTMANTITNVSGIIPGLISVTNPQPASAGKDEEGYEEMKARMLDKRLEEDLLVVPRDYESAVRRYLGEGAQALVITPPPEPGFVHLSILYADGNPLVVNSGLEDEINRRSPMARCKFTPPDIIDIAVTAKIHYSAQATKKEVVEEVAKQKLNALFDPRGWSGWGRTPNVAYRSEIISALQEIQGVLSVELSFPTQDINLGSANAVTRLSTVSLEILPILVEATV